MILMLVIIVVLLVKVLPIFNQVYEQLGGRMSGTAQMLLQFGNLLGNFMPVLCGILGAIVLLAIIFGSSSAARGVVVRCYKKLFGSFGITKKMGEARFASAMAMGMMSGLNTEEAFRTAMLFQDGGARTKKRYEKCLETRHVGPGASRWRNVLSRIRFWRRRTAGSWIWAPRAVRRTRLWRR